MRRLLTIALLAAGQVFAAGVQTLPAPPNGATAQAVQVDSAGNLYIAGSTSSGHAFVAKLTAGNTQTVWFTSFAGSKGEVALTLALGPSGSVYAAGVTQSTNFPTTQGAMQATGAAGSVFAVELDASGNVVYATYLPTTYCAAIAVDSAGHLMLTGTLQYGQAFTATTGAVMGAPLPTGIPYTTSYLLELDPTGAKTDLAIIGFGGAQVTFDSQGYIYAAGGFMGQLAPTTTGAFQSTVAVNVCASGQLGPILYCPYQHIAKIDPTGTQLIYATYLDGSWGAAPGGIAVDSAGNVIVAGTTGSPDYPTTPDAYQPEFFGSPRRQYLGPDTDEPPTAGYVTKLNATGTGLIWSTYFGGSGARVPDSAIVGDSIAAMALDTDGNIVLVGFAGSADLPGLWNTPVALRPIGSQNYQPVLTGFVGRVSANGATISPTQLVSGLQFSEPPWPNTIALAPDGSAVLVASPVMASPLVDVSLSALGRVEAICDPADEAKIVNVAPGQLLTLYGSNLAPANSPNGVAIAFNGIAAPILYASGDQINLQVPYEIAGQTQVTMQVSSSSVTPAVSEQYILGVVARQPGAFVSEASFSDTLFDAATCNGQTVAGVEALALNADGSVNSCTNPAVPGATVMVFLDGMGVTSPAQATGAISASAAAIAPPAALVPSPNGSLPTALPTQTIAGLVADVVGVQVPAPASSSAVQLELVDAPGVTYLVRGPGVIVWVAQ